jgi:hypothetical protein
MESVTEDDNDLTGDIAHIEARIETLAGIAERCRKFILASKLAVGAGVILLLSALLGLIGSGQLALWSIALVLGGIVSLGSNQSTLHETEADLAEAEARRAQFIGAINLRLVHDAPSKLM